MSEPLQILCKCGAFQAQVDADSLRTGNHGMCYCEDCQAFQRYLGQQGTYLDAQGGTELFQAQSWQIKITQGKENLQIVKLSPKGLYRWHTSCCKTPLFNTVGNPKIAFAGIIAGTIQVQNERLGPINFRYKTEQATAPVTEPKGSMIKFVFRTMRNILGSRISGRWKDTPLFDPDTGRSIVKPYVLSEAERAKAYSA